MASQALKKTIVPDWHAEVQSQEALNAQLVRVFDLREHGDTSRSETEQFILDCFQAAHGARVVHFMPRLLSLNSRDGRRIAAFGLRPAAEDVLFLENYLDQPVEQVLADHVGHPVRREEIIEVGNLSALYPGAARWLIVALTSMLRHEGYRWVVFTGTTALRNGFGRLGLRLVELGAASLDALPPEQRSSWGSYYENAPLVMAGDIAYGFKALLMQRNLSAVLRANLSMVDSANPA